jgi:transcriptional regulator with XRE-family HTH domain
MPENENDIELLFGISDDIDYILEKQKVQIAEEIIAQMESKHISKAELARKLDVSNSYISKIFKTNINFTLKSLVQISHAIGASISIHFHPKEARTAWLDFYDYSNISNIVRPIEKFPSTFNEVTFAEKRTKKEEKHEYCTTTG